MVEFLKQQFTSNMNSKDKLNILCESLQLTVLKIIYDKNYFDNIAFVGGTALRILHNNKRFSEDLDFSLINGGNFNFSDFNSELMRGLKLYGLDLESKPKEDTAVKSSLLKFKGLLKELGLSDLESQKLSIKVKIDTNPPSGWNCEDVLVNKIYMMNLKCFDLPSLYATKLHACFYRKYIKGRDFYDLVWYLSKKIVPNYLLLNKAIKQTEGLELNLNESNFKDFLIERIKNVDFKAAKKDVERFLEDKNEVNLLNKENILRVLEK